MSKKTATEKLNYDLCLSLHMIGDMILDKVKIGQGTIEDIGGIEFYWNVNYKDEHVYSFTYKGITVFCSEHKVLQIEAVGIELWGTSLIDWAMKVRSEAVEKILELLEQEYKPL